MAGKTPEVLRGLREAAQGLTFPSETDAPVEAFAHAGAAPQRITAETVLPALKVPHDAPVRTRSLEEFFEPVTQEQAWHNAEERETVQRFRKLVQALKENLTDIQVFEVGEVEKDVYVVGKTADGDLAGVKTQVVET